MQVIELAPVDEQVERSLERRRTGWEEGGLVDEEEGEAGFVEVRDFW
jgi:hypothetical protein